MKNQHDRDYDHESALAEDGTKDDVKRRTKHWFRWVIIIVLWSIILAYLWFEIVPQIRERQEAARVDVPASIGFDRSLLGVIQLPEKHYVQGLEVHDSEVFISSGGYGESYVVKYLYENNGELAATEEENSSREVAKGTLTEVARFEASKELFLEGITVVDDSIYVLTWKEGVVLQLDRETLEPVGQHRIDHEGWGLCYEVGHDRFWVSSGEKRLTAYDRRFQKLAEVQVEETNLNELECGDGFVLANVWRQDKVIAIDVTGAKEGESVRAESTTVETFTGLEQAYGEKLNSDSVLNGLALREVRSIVADVDDTLYPPSLHPSLPVETGLETPEPDVGLPPAPAIEVTNELWVAGKEFTHILIFDFEKLPEAR